MSQQIWKKNPLNFEAFESLKMGRATEGGKLAELRSRDNTFLTWKYCYPTKATDFNMNLKEPIILMFLPNHTRLKSYNMLTREGCK